MKSSINSILLVGLIVVTSCNDNNEDVAPTKTEDINISVGSPALINPILYFGETYVTGATFRVVQQPNHGSVTTVQDNKYFKYIPDGSSVTDDSFIVEIISTSGEQLDIKTMRINQLSNCNRAPIVTQVTMRKNEVLNLNLLDNDVFCNLSWYDAVVCACGADNGGGPSSYTLEKGTATFTYKPKLNFTGVSVFHYILGVNPNDGVDMTVGSELLDHPEWFEHFVTIALTVEVVE